MSAGDAKKEEALCGSLQTVINEMSEEQFSFVVELASDQLRAWYTGEKAHLKDVALAIKTAMDSYIPGTWHVIIGKAFGSFVTHENKRLAYFFLGGTAFLIFKHG